MISPDLATSALLTTATAAYLGAVTRATRFSIGLPVHNRGDAATRDLIGPIMEVYPVDVVLEPGQTYRSLHKAISRSIMTTLANAVPGTAPTGDYGAVVNVIARAGVGSFGDAPTSTSWIHSGAIDSAHLVRVQYTAYDQTMALDLNVAAAGTAHQRNATAHIRSILAAMLADPDRVVGGPELPIDEFNALRRWELGEKAADGTAADQSPTVIDRLRAALADSDHQALTDRETMLSGRELWSSVMSCAAWLGTQGVARGSRVGIGMARSADAVVAILATLAAGGSFVPLDPTLPAGRRKRLAERAGATLVLDAIPSRMPPSEAGDPFASDRSLGVTPPKDDDEAYLLFTSGSTGEPKGVPITHRGLAGYLDFARES
jgi:non-ribosomal peptide synthetase component F